MCGKSLNVMEIRIQRKSDETGGWIDLLRLDLCKDCLTNTTQKVEDGTKREV